MPSVLEKYGNTALNVPEHIPIENSSRCHAKITHCQKISFFGSSDVALGGNFLACASCSLLVSSAIVLHFREIWNRGDHNVVKPLGKFITPLENDCK